jgi:hypothetical protein
LVEHFFLEAKWRIGICLLPFFSTSLNLIRDGHLLGNKHIYEEAKKPEKAQKIKKNKKM